RLELFGQAVVGLLRQPGHGLVGAGHGRTPEVFGRYLRAIISPLPGVHHGRLLIHVLSSIRRIVMPEEVLYRCLLRALHLSQPLFGSMSTLESTPRRVGA